MQRVPFYCWSINFFFFLEGGFHLIQHLAFSKRPFPGWTGCRWSIKAENPIPLAFHWCFNCSASLYLPPSFNCALGIFQVPQQIYSIAWLSCKRLAWFSDRSGGGRGVTNRHGEGGWDAERITDLRNAYHWISALPDGALILGLICHLSLLFSGWPHQSGSAKTDQCHKPSLELGKGASLCSSLLGTGDRDDGSLLPSFWASGTLPKVPKW